MRPQLSAFAVPTRVWQQTRTALGHCDPKLAQGFSVFERGRGKEWEFLPPLLLRARDREGLLAVESLLQQSPPSDHEVILEVTRNEIQKGFYSQLMFRQEVDDLFGHWKWRPLEQFLIRQADGKDRVIDNARKTGHNAHTEMCETMFTVSVDFVCARQLAYEDSTAMPLAAHARGHR